MVKDLREVGISSVMCFSFLALHRLHRISQKIISLSLNTFGMLVANIP